MGAIWGTRRLVYATAAFAGYAVCDERAEVAGEAYLSAYQFGDDFRHHLDTTGSTAGFTGPCWSPWLWFDIDHAGDLERARREAARLAMMLDIRYETGEDNLLVFFSGSKGFHVGLPTSMWLPEPSVDFPRTVRQFAEQAAARAEVTIDSGVYDRVRAFRAPNSRHPGTGLHKRRFTLDELKGLSLERIAKFAHEPEAFEVPERTGTSDAAIADWQTAAAQVTAEREANVVRHAVRNGSPTLNRATLEFIREGAAPGNRHNRLFAAAANLADFGCPSALAFALLEEAALDSGLPPREVRRTIENGLQRQGGAR